MLKQDDKAHRIWEAPDAGSSDLFVTYRENGDVLLEDDGDFQMEFTPEEWKGLIEVVKNGELDIP